MKKHFLFPVAIAFILGVFLMSTTYKMAGTQYEYLTIKGSEYDVFVSNTVDNTYKFIEISDEEWDEYGTDEGDYRYPLKYIQKYEKEGWELLSESVNYDEKGYLFFMMRKEK